MASLFEFLDNAGLGAVLAEIKTWITKKLNNKVDQEDGKGLSSNDFTDELQEKLVNTPVVLYGTEDLEPGVSKLDPGTIYIVHAED